MIRQAEFDADGMVSIWVGNFSSEDDFDNYMNLAKDFEKDFGFKVDNRGISPRTGALRGQCPPFGQQALRMRPIPEGGDGPPGERRSFFGNFV